MTNVKGDGLRFEGVLALDASTDNQQQITRVPVVRDFVGGCKVSQYGCAFSEGKVVFYQAWNFAQRVLRSILRRSLLSLVNQNLLHFDFDPIRPVQGKGESDIALVQELRLSTQVYFTVSQVKKGHESNLQKMTTALAGWLM